MEKNSAVFFIKETHLHLGDQDADAFLVFMLISILSFF